MTSYETALKINPEAVIANVNISLLYSITGRNDLAEKKLRQAVLSDPENFAVQFNLGLLLAEMGKSDEAVKRLRLARKIDPTSAQTAYNLAELIASEHIEDAIELCKITAELQPDEPKYRYTYIFYLQQGGWGNKALEEAI